MPSSSPLLFHVAVAAGHNPAFAGGDPAQPRLAIHVGLAIGIGFEIGVWLRIGVAIDRIEQADQPYRSRIRAAV
jgi:hypothetical protein